MLFRIVKNNLITYIKRPKILIWILNGLTIYRRIKNEKKYLSAQIIISYLILYTLLDFVATESCAQKRPLWMV